MFSRLIFWPWLAGLAVLLPGLIAGRKSLAAATGLEKLIALGPLFFAIPLAVFGAEHLSNVRGITEVVPAWMPVRVFWTYFVGLALISAALSLALNIHTRLAAGLLAILFLCFELTIHIPNAIAHPDNRFIWAVVFREFGFAAGACALASGGRALLRHVARTVLGVTLFFFAIEHFLHPEFAPGVPLAKVTPGWVPLRAFWGYLTGTALLVSGSAMLTGRLRPRLMAELLGAWVILLTLALYLPIFVTAALPALLEGINYVADTLLLAGTVLLVGSVLDVEPGVAGQATGVGR